MDKRGGRERWGERDTERERQRQRRQREKEKRERINHLFALYPIHDDESEVRVVDVLVELREEGA